MEQKTLFIEGKRSGPVETVEPQNRAFAGVADGSLSLQNAFTVLFEQLVSPLDARFIIEMAGGWKDALKNFAKCNEPEIDAKFGLLIDLIDADTRQKGSVGREGKLAIIKSQLQTWADGQILRESTDHHLLAFPQVYFMKMKMEGWILSQPEILEACFGDLGANKTAFDANWARLIKTHAAELLNPDDILHEQLRYFEVERNGKTRKMGYQKGKHAAELLRQLDAHKLIEEFGDVRSLVEFLQKGN